MREHGGVQGDTAWDRESLFERTFLADWKIHIARHEKADPRFAERIAAGGASDRLIGPRWLAKVNVRGHFRRAVVAVSIFVWCVSHKAVKVGNAARHGDCCVLTSFTASFMCDLRPQIRKSDCFREGR